MNTREKKEQEIERLDTQRRSEFSHKKAFLLARPKKTERKVTTKEAFTIAIKWSLHVFCCQDKKRNCMFTGVDVHSLFQSSCRSMWAHLLMEGRVRGSGTEEVTARSCAFQSLIAEQGESKGGDHSSEPYSRQSGSRDTGKLPAIHSPGPRFNGYFTWNSHIPLKAKFNEL